MPAQTTVVGLGGKRESPQPTASGSAHVPPGEYWISCNDEDISSSLVTAVQSHQGMVPAHVNYLPGTPSPTFPGLQSTILQTGGEENFPIDFLHESDLRGGLCTKHET